MKTIRTGVFAVAALLACAGCDEQKAAVNAAASGAAASASTAAVAALNNAAAVATAAASAASAQVVAQAKAPVLPPAAYDLDLSHTKIGFSVRHMMVSNTRGEFKVFSGKANIDQGDLSKMNLQVEIDVSSIDTGDKKRDTHLNSADFFDSKKFPKMTFKSTKVEADGEGYKVTGDLTIKDVTKAVVLKVDPLTAEMKGMYGGFLRGTHATATINRTDFGLKYNAAIEAGGVAIGEEVKLDFEIELSRKAEGAPVASGSASAPAAAPKASAH
jgi:polyisoprenoid-binding protein YceI